AVRGNLPLPAKVTMEISNVDALACYRASIEVEGEPEAQRRLREKCAESLQRKESILRRAQHDASSFILADEAAIRQPPPISFRAAGSIGGHQQRIGDHCIRSTREGLVPVLLS